MKFLQNKSVYFSLLLVFLTPVAASFAPAQTYETYVKEKVAEIRGDVAAINAGAVKYAKKTKSVEDVSLEGAEATYYFSGKNLKKITAEIFGETYGSTAEFYYKNGELIFAYLKRSEYDTQTGLDASPKVVSAEEQRFYFAGNGDLIRLLIGEKELKSADKRYGELKSGIVEISAKLKDSGAN